MRFLSVFFRPKRVSFQFGDVEVPSQAGVQEFSVTGVFFQQVGLLYGLHGRELHADLSRGIEFQLYPDVLAVFLYIEGTAHCGDG